MFRLLVENVRDYAIFMLDPNGIVASWNAGAQHIKGYTREEIVGKHFSAFYTPDAIARRWPQHELAVAREQGRFEDEGWRLRKDGTTFWANVVITPVYDEKRQLRGFAKITRDLTTRRKVEELQRTERQMNEFLGMLAHELRNPLAPIRSALDIAARKPDDLGTAAWARAIIDRQAEHLSRLVDDLVDVSRITRGKVKLRRQPTDLGATIAHVVDAFTPAATERRHTIAVTVPSAPLVAAADPTRVAQILSNVLGNAIKYTPDGGHITVDAKASDEMVSIVVSDTGIGMAADLVPRIFDLFVQGERGLDRRDGGLGVGLTVARRLTELLGGTLSASSAGPGLGSRFLLELPMLHPGEDEHVATEAQTETRSARRKRVLIIEDNADVADSLAALIGILGHDVSVLRDGRDALRVAPAAPPDVVLLDIGLPGMDGFEVARRLRSFPELVATRLVACTGYGREEDVRKIREAGFERHFMKPVGAAQLETLLAE
ncbi:MAG TPA: ATP-binding protein [Casimicrobiaceae bacterium]|nr:ATP-binding protein [Casimicrobiaceae bacterium]